MRQYKGRKRIGKTQDTRRTTQGRRLKSERLKRLKRRVGEREKGRKGEKRHKTHLSTEASAKVEDARKAGRGDRGSGRVG